MNKLITILSLIFLISTISFSETNTNVTQLSENVFEYDVNLQESYSEYYDILLTETNLVFDWATRYMVIMSELPSITAFPYFGITINNDKSFDVENRYDKITIKYDYGSHGFDELQYITSPYVVIEYKGDLANRDFLTTPFLNLYIGTAILYNHDTTNIINISQVGYCFKLSQLENKFWHNLTFTPSFGFNLSNHYYDIFFNVGYNIYNQLNIGIGLSILRQDLGIFIGANL